MESQTPCPGCGLSFNCVCQCIPKLDIDAHFALLMHENELSRDTNTGQWLLAAIPSSSRHIWQRKSPCSELMKLLDDPSVMPYLLFPGEESIAVSDAKRIALNTEKKKPLFLILDGTWQEAKKMLRKSAWLQTLPLVHINPSQNSVYQLRRNQSDGHLCTLEVGAEVIRELGDAEQADRLMQFFTHYMRVFQADKSGHPFQN
ncbi:tRNA-uridine aminocarboxypropyltransferase [Vibrio japonicus]|uniref:tRNA-uridine aminocarboxypropyltransferase n=1 Tax=Vibrio japonicus TaxID=1824638 RepID=A0ABY5LID9_9VIBR|nr:DTW domain-containing protein [Vibrio japonicus]UUM30711.1 DTW domain-containing protein [Vibrio japonicus]